VAVEEVENSVANLRKEPAFAGSFFSDLFFR